MGECAHIRWSMFTSLVHVCGTTAFVGQTHLKDAGNVLMVSEVVALVAVIVVMFGKIGALPHLFQVFSPQVDNCTFKLHLLLS